MSNAITVPYANPPSLVHFGENDLWEKMKEVAKTTSQDIQTSIKIYLSRISQKGAVHLMNILSADGFDYNSGNKLFAKMEAAAYQEGCRVATEKMKAELEAMDDVILKVRDKNLYRSKDVRQGTIKTIAGEVSYMRRYYEVNNDQGGHVFLLDEYLGFGEGVFSETLKDAIVNECMNMSFRAAADAISTVTNQRVSHGGVWNIVQERGAQVAAKEDRMVEYNEQHELCGGIETKVLFEEMDGVYLSMQGKDRPKKIGKREIKVATHYSGWEETSKDRFETVGKVSYVGFDAPKEFHKKREAQIARFYDMDEIDVRILNGDGAEWIKGTDEAVVMQLDMFHRNRAILRGLSEKVARAQVMQLLKAKDVEGMLRLIAAMRDSSTDDKQKKRIGELYTYFSNNKEHLLTWKERGIELPPPPDGIVYRNLGTQEHSNSVLITQRMKRRKASWSIKGAEHMAKLLCLQLTNKSLYRYGGIMLTEIVNKQILAPLSAAQTPKHDGRGYNGGAVHGGWPFENTFVTEGRKAMRNILRITPK